MATGRVHRLAAVTVAAKGRVHRLAGVAPAAGARGRVHRLAAVTAPSAHGLVHRLAAVITTPLAPTARPTATPHARPGHITVLECAGSTSPFGTIEAWAWTCLSASDGGTLPALDDYTTARPTFRAPLRAAAVTYTIGLVVTDTQGHDSPQAVVTVPVAAAQAAFGLANGTMGPAALIADPRVPAPLPPPPPPPSPTTIVGFNTSLGTVSTQAQMDTRIIRFGAGRVPCGRGYYGNGAMPADGSGFTTGGKEYKLAGLHLAPQGVVSSKRVNVCTHLNVAGTAKSGGGTYTQPNETARLNEIVAYAMSVPTDWTIYLGDHEYNGGWTAATPQADIDQYVGAQYRVAWAIADAFVAAGRTPNVSWIVNIAGSGIKTGAWNSTMAPPANPTATYPRGMPKGTLFTSDNYDNPKASGGIKAYATKYGHENGAIKASLDDLYFNGVSPLGYAHPDYGWGIGEAMSPRRVGPLAAGISPTDRATLGWADPATGVAPDLSGARQAAAMKYYLDLCLGYPVPAKLILLWFAPDGNNWNQSLISAGDDLYDAWVNGSGVLQTVKLTSTAGLVRHPTLNQGWPIDVDDSLFNAMFRPYLVGSA